MVNIKFPATDVVSCIFSLKNSNSACNQNFTKYDIVPYEGQHKLKEYYYRVPKHLEGQPGPSKCMFGITVCYLLSTGQHMHL